MTHPSEPGDHGKSDEAADSGEAGEPTASGEPAEHAGPGASGGPDAPGDGRTGKRPRQRKQVLLRLDPLMHEALTRWAADELRSVNAQIDHLLRKALAEAGRLPRGSRPHPRRGRPRREGG